MVSFKILLVLIILKTTSCNFIKSYTRYIPSERSWPFPFSWKWLLQHSYGKKMNLRIRESRICKRHYQPLFYTSITVRRPPQCQRSLMSRNEFIIRLSVPCSLNVVNDLFTTSRLTFVLRLFFRLRSKFLLLSSGIRRSPYFLNFSP